MAQPDDFRGRRATSRPFVKAGANSISVHCEVWPRHPRDGEANPRPGAARAAFDRNQFPRTDGRPRYCPSPSIST